MRTPVRVTVVRPRLTVHQALIAFMSEVIALAVRGWIVMLLAPGAIGGLHPSYFQSVATCFAFSMLLGQLDQYSRWTTEADQ